MSALQSATNGFKRRVLSMKYRMKYAVHGWGLSFSLGMLTCFFGIGATAAPVTSGIHITAALEAEHTLSLVQIEGLHTLAGMLKKNAKTFMDVLPVPVKAKLGFV